MEKLVSDDICHVRNMDRDIVLPDVVDDDRTRRHHRDPGLRDGHHVPSRRWQYAGARLDRDTLETR